MGCDFHAGIYDQKSVRGGRHAAPHGQRRLKKDPVIANRPGPATVNKAKRASVAPSRLTLR
jgi:hypothetical protein